MRTVERYLQRASVHESWPIELPPGLHGGDTAVVIPACDEEHTLPEALASLAQQSSDVLSQVFVVCVVNNPSPVDTTPERIAANQRTLAWLRGRKGDALRVAIVDASSPGKELPLNEGVGLARRIGMDHAIDCFFHSHRDAEGLIISFDADSTVSEGYLAFVMNFFRDNNLRAAVTEYEHPGEGPIGAYEIFLRYCTLGLRYAQSPYAFHTIGSAMAFRGSAYVDVQGMPKKSAAEDFYLLQKLAKLEPMGYIPDAVVHPSARVSDRVPFGTGAAMSQHAKGDRAFTHLHDPHIYEVLREWLTYASHAFAATPNDVVVKAKQIDIALHGFLVERGVEKTWTKLQANASNAERFAKAFHGWFDALATLRCVHHMRDCAYPDVPMEEALTGLLGPDAPAVRDDPAILSHLRKLQRGGWST